MAAAVDVFAHLIISNGSDTIAVEAEHSRICIDIDTLGTAIDFAKQNAHQGQWRKRLNWLQEGCQAVGFDVYVCLAGKPIARLGPHARPGLTSRLLGLGAVELRPWRTGIAWWQSKRSAS